MSIYVVDTGTEEIYVLAEDECDASEQVVAMIGHEVLYSEYFSDDPEDMP